MFFRKRVAGFGCCRSSLHSKRPFRGCMPIAHQGMHDPIPAKCTVLARPMCASMPATPHVYIHACFKPHVKLLSAQSHGMLCAAYTCTTARPECTRRCMHSSMHALDPAVHHNTCYAVQAARRSGLVLGHGESLPGGGEPDIFGRFKHAVQKVLHG